MSSNPGEPHDALAAEPRTRLVPPRDVTEDWAQDLVEHSRDLLCIHDLEGCFLSVNPVPARLLGYSVEEILKIPMRELIDRAFRDQFDLYLRTIASAGEAAGILAVLTRAGQRRYWEYHCTLRIHGVEKPVVRGIAHDVTDRIRTEKSLRTTNDSLQASNDEQETMLHRLRLFRSLLDHSNDAIEIVDPETFRFLDVNEKSCAELGYTREELLSKTIFDIAPFLTPDHAVKTRNSLAKTSFRILESVHRRKDGTTLPVEISLKRVRLDREYVVAVSRDITERQRADKALRKSEAELREAQTVARMGNWHFDLQTGTVTGSDQLFRFFAREPQPGGIPFRELEQLFLPETWLQVVQANRKALETGNPEELELAGLRPDGSLVWLLIRGKAETDEAGRVIGLSGIAIDITDRKHSEQALRDSEERFRLAQEAAQIGTYDRNLQTGENRWTPEMEKIYGLPPGAAPPSVEKFLALVFPEDQPRVAALFASSIESGEAGGEWRTVWPDGSTHWISGRWRVIKNANGQPVRLIGSDYDMTDRKRAEETLRTNEEHFRLFIEHAPAGLAMFDREMRYLHVSRRWRTDYHLEDRYLRGLSHYDVFPDIPERWKQAHRRGLAGEVVREDSDRFDRADGSMYWLRWEIRPWHDKTGAVGGIVIFAEDITERKRIEEELRHAKERLTEEKLYLQQEIESQFGFEEIIGRSQPLRDVMESVGKVAATDATVLLLGETGTGKELVARAIHRLSRRAGNAFIKMNCAAIPSGLLESELFGNEKGAFTGAVGRKLGRLELADQGTIFLDEIGEISLSLQPKLLRVLQDQEFERLGGTQTLKVNFRLIAATNRDLARSVRDKEFRSDLFYRLNIFPIFLPPLRERREDIPLLVEHFVQKISGRMKKSITSIPKKTMDALTNWSWPGNVRELENFIERSLILSSGSVLAAPLSELQPVALDPIQEQTLEAAERRHILDALRESRGQVSGPRGAAKRLGLKRTTLQSKLKHLGINPRGSS